MKFSNVELPSNRKFGIFFGVIFTLACCYSFNANSLIFAWMFVGLAIIFFLIALIRPDVLLPLNKLWMRLGILLGIIISPIVLAAIFFVVFTPVGIMMRLIGRDELKLKPKILSSYWKVRDPVGLAAGSFRNQF